MLRMTLVCRVLAVTSCMFAAFDWTDPMFQYALGIIFALLSISHSVEESK